MPLSAKGSEIEKSMEKTYGSKEKAEQVLYASKNAGKITGIDSFGKALDAVADACEQLNRRVDAYCARRADAFAEQPAQDAVAEQPAQNDDRRVIGGVNSGTLAVWGK